MNLKDLVIYQIYPRSFFDSNGDGIGDIQGICSKLDYLSSLGVNALWLSPIFVSPMKDGGYDIADYYHVDPLFGKDEDLFELIEKAKAKGIGIILDLVANHTSDQNPWFLESKKSKDNPYRDFYIWRDKEEINDIQSAFGGSAWTLDKTTGQYYFHLFAKEQPDLNWANPKLRDTMYQMMNYWLDKGVIGFRMDVIENIGKDIDAHIVNDGPRLHDYLHEMNQKCLAKHQAVSIGETWCSNNETRVLYLDPKREELNMIFQFDQLTMFFDPIFNKWVQKPFDLLAYKKAIFAHQLVHPKKVWNALFLENHDIARSIDRYGDRNSRKAIAKMLPATFLFQKGTPFIYQGEELGMINADIQNWNEIRDTEAFTMRPELAKKGMDEEMASKKALWTSRDNCRSPMQWNNSKNAGFSKAEPWLKVHDKELNEYNVENEEKDSKSILATYQKLLQLRKEHLSLIQEGKFVPLFEEDPKLFAYQMVLGEHVLSVVCVFSKQEAQIPSLSHLGKLIDAEGELGAPYSYSIYYR